MPDADPDDSARTSGTGKWATVNFVVALVLILAIAALRWRATLADAAGLLLLSALGILALVSAGLLFRSLLRR